MQPLDLERLKEILEEQKRTSLYTLTLDKYRLYGALIQAGLAVPAFGVAEFVLAPGATAVVIFPVPPGFVFLTAGPANWHTSLPWWCSYSFWLDQTPPATPLAAVIRMPDMVSIPDTSGIFPVRGFAYHQVTNLHVAQTAYCGIEAFYMLVPVAVWDMIKGVYLDPIVAELRRLALQLTGVWR